MINNHNIPLLQDRAIKLAAEQKWQEAIAVNKLILKQDPKDIASLNRLTRAYINTKKWKKAGKFCERVLKLDRYNPIAKKNYNKLKVLGKLGKTKLETVKPPSISEVNFIEEPGITMETTLTRLGDKSLIAILDPGEPLKIVPKTKYLTLQNRDNKYIGAMPSDVSFRLIKLIKLGYEYSAFFKSGADNNIRIFIRETHRPKRYKNQPSFIHGHLANKIIGNKLKSFSNKKTLLDEEPIDITSTGEE